MATTKPSKLSQQGCGRSGSVLIAELVLTVRLGIMLMFGGFTAEFFDAYHKVIPRVEPHYNERIKLYELYHQ